MDFIFWQHKLLLRLKSAALGEIYSQLDKQRTQIRLLSLAAANNRSDPLRGELNIVVLEHDRKFMALSYVWGYAKQVSTIALCSI